MIELWAYWKEALLAGIAIPVAVQLAMYYLGLYADTPPGSRTQLLVRIHMAHFVAGVGTGGMATKLQAARIATAAGISVVLASFNDHAAAVSGGAVGTLFHPTGKKRARRLMWLAYASQAKGDLVLDDGAVRAVLERKASLLPAGITAVHGEFLAGEPVRLLDLAGAVIARGIVNYDAADLPSILGKSTHALVAERGPEFDREVVHRDALIVKLRRRSATG